MAISLTAAMTSALGANISQPGLFLQLGFTTPLYFCDRDTRTWNSQSWTSDDFSVGNYSVNAGMLQQLQLDFVDPDYSLAALLLMQTTSDKNVKLWYFDSTATATLDPVLIFDGIMDNPSGGDGRKLQIPCTTVSKLLPVGMLAHLIPSYLFIAEGTKLVWGIGKTIEFNRRQEYK